MSEAIQFASLIMSASNIALQEIRARKTKQAESFLNEHYREHSRLLTNALQRWIQGLRFTTYDYRDGELSKHIPERIEPESIEYIEYMKKHLNKSYPSVLPTPAQIESEHKGLCADIEKIISSTSVVPGKPAYELIIIEKIKAVCPGLRPIHDITLTQNDIYLYKYLFAIIFETVKRQDTKMDLTVKPTSKSDVKQLFYEGYKVLAQGSEGNLMILKRTIEELIKDDSIKRRISEYEVLVKKLKNDAKVQGLEEFATEMRTQINGGRILGGYPACDLCDPDKPVDLQPRM